MKAPALVLTAVFLTASACRHPSSNLQGFAAAPNAQYVFVKVERDNLQTHWLHFTVTNPFPGEVKIYAYTLPWARSVLTMLLASLSPGAQPRIVEPALLALDNPNDEVRTLRKGESISGRLRLDERFLLEGKTFNFSAEGVENYCLFWSYQLETTDGRKAIRVGGVIPLNMRD